MKKYLYTLLFMAVALFSASALVSCGDDEDDPKPEPLPVAQNYAKYTAKLSEGIFEYCDVAVTIEVDGKKEVYPFDEKTKVDDMKIQGLEKTDVQKAGRVLEIPVFKFDVHPLKVTTEIKLTEAGKQKIAKATTEEMDFVVYLDYGECEASGLRYIMDCSVVDLFLYEGVHVTTFETFLNNFNNERSSFLVKTFK